MTLARTEGFLEADATPPTPAALLLSMTNMDTSRGVTAEAMLAHAGWMRALAYSLVRDPERADDVVQQSWLAAIERPPRHAGNLPAWLRRVVTSSARQMRRSEGRRSAREQACVPADDAPPSTAELVEEMELQREVAATILQLPEPYRSTVLLRFYRDHTPREIAAMQGVPAATVRSRLKRALEQLRGELDRHYDGDRKAWCTALLPLMREPVALVALSAGGKGLLALGAVALATFATWWLARPPASSPPSSPELLAASEPMRDPAQTDVDSQEPMTPERAEGAIDERAIAPASATPTTAAYHGSLTDPDGEPIVGATLRIYPKDRGNWRDEEVIASGPSDERGGFSIPVPDGLDTSRYLLIEASAEGYQSLSMDPVVPESPITITLNWTALVHGRVIDAVTEEPVAGAWLSSWGAEATSDANGAYRLPNVPVAQRVHLRVHKEGYAVIDEYVSFEGRQPEPHTVRLHPGEPMRLHVFDADSGDPLSGADVFNGYENRVGATDENGEFVVWIAEGAKADLRVRKPDYADFAWEVEVKDTALLRSPRVPMRGLGWIEGAAHDEEGEPLVGCYYYASNKAMPFNNVRLDAGQQVEFGLPGYVRYEIEDDAPATDEAGRFSIPVLPSPEPFSLGGGSQEHVTPDSGPIHVTASGQRVWLDLVQRTGATVRGHVRYNGEGLSFLTVYYEDEAGSAGGYARTDSDGFYEMRTVPAGDVVLKVRTVTKRTASEPDPVPLTVEAGEAYDQDIEWSEQLGSITGTIVETDGRPVPDQTVHALESDGTGPSFSSTSTVTGYFEIDVAPGFDYTLVARRGPASVNEPDVSVGTRGVQLVLPEVGTVRIRLVDAVTGEGVNADHSSLWGLGWRESGTEVFGYERHPFRREGVIELDVTVGDSATVDLNISLTDDGYAPKRVYGLPVARGETTGPVERIELERGISCKILLDGDEPLSRELRDGHLFFVLRDDELDALRGPYPKQGGPSNHRINGVNMWVAEPSLLYRMPEFDHTGLIYMRGLAPGRYTLKAFPDSYAFEPAFFELSENGQEIDLRWSTR